MNRHEVKKFLDFDVIDLAEKISKDEEGSMALGFVMNKIKRKVIEREMKDRGDTYPRISFIDFRRILIDNDFKLIYEEEFQGKDYKDIQVIYWKDDEGLLLTADSYSGQKNVNSAKIYYNWKSEIINASNVFELDITQNGCFLQMKPYPIWIGSYYANEALIYHLDGLRTYGEFIPEWVQTPFLWLLNYNDSDGEYESYSYEEINKQKLAKIDPQIRNKFIRKESEYYIG